MYVIGRVLSLTGGLKVQHTEVVQPVGVGLDGGQEVSGSSRVASDGLPPQVVFETLV